MVQKKKGKHFVIGMFSESLKLKVVQSQSYRNTSKVMHFGKVYFDPLHDLLGPCGYIYDNRNVEHNCVMRYYSDFDNNQTPQKPRIGIHINSLK